MAFTFALAGKGGTGKTTLAALVVRALNEAGARSVLAVDADPNATLHEALGVEVERSVGEITEEMLASVEALPGGMSKDAYMEYNINQYLVEKPAFDLLSMGRPEGAGCYCYANNLVRGCMDDLSRGYEYVVMDNEAGLEHLSRRTTRDVDYLLLVSDPSLRGTGSVTRLSGLADELKIGVGGRGIVYNRASEPIEPVLLEAATDAGIDVVGVVPDDPGIGAADLAGQGLFELDDDSPALAAAKRIVAAVAPLEAAAGL